MEGHKWVVMEGWEADQWLAWAQATEKVFLDSLTGLGQDVTRRKFGLAMDEAYDLVQAATEARGQATKYVAVSGKGTRLVEVEGYGEAAPALEEALRGLGDRYLKAWDIGGRKFLIE